VDEDEDRHKWQFLFASERLEDLAALAIAAVILLIVLLIH